MDDTKRYPSIQNYTPQSGKIVRINVDENEKIGEIIQEYLIQYGYQGMTDGSWNISEFVIRMMYMTKEEREALLLDSDFDKIENRIKSNK
jgi:hypothetical protein